MCAMVLLLFSWCWFSKYSKDIRLPILYIEKLPMILFGVESKHIKHCFPIRVVKACLPLHLIAEHLNLPPLPINHFNI